MESCDQCPKKDDRIVRLKAQLKWWKDHHSRRKSHWKGVAVFALFIGILIGVVAESAFIMRRNQPSALSAH